MAPIVQSFKHYYLNSPPLASRWLFSQRRRAQSCHNAVLLWPSTSAEELVFDSCRWPKVRWMSRRVGLGVSTHLWLDGGVCWDSWQNEKYRTDLCCVCCFLNSIKKTHRPWECLYEVCAPKNSVLNTTKLKQGITLWKVKRGRKSLKPELFLLAIMLLLKQVAAAKAGCLKENGSTSQLIFFFF